MRGALAPLAVTLSCLAVVVLTQIFVDRPLSTWLHATFEGIGDLSLVVTDAGHPLRVTVFTLMAGPGEIAGPLSVVGLAVLGFALACGWVPGETGRLAGALCVASLLAYAVKSELKWAFGRTWPDSWLGNNPSWIKTQAFGFSPFHGGLGWESFPSGHITMVVAPLAVLWWCRPRFRPLYGAVALMVTFGLLCGDYHFLSDIIAGAYVGLAIGWLVAMHMLNPARTGHIEAR